MNVYMVAGITTGLFIGLLLVIFLLKVTKSDGSMKCKYDERQASVRGKGFKMAFITLAVYDGIYGLLGIMTEKQLFIDPFTAMVIGVCISALIYVVYCIWHDAYFSLNENRKRLLVAFGFITLFNLVIGSINMTHGEVVVNGVLTFRSTNLVCGLMFMVIFAALLAKTIRNKREENRRPYEES